MQTRVIQQDPRKLRLLEINARYMRHEVFMRLTKNVQGDGVLTQIPFAALWGYHQEGDPIQYHEDGTPVYEVLSGNHRVKAAIAADLDVIDVQVTDDPLTPDQRRAIQLSHNELVGEDDPATLKAIYDSIEGVHWRVYSGLDDKKLALLGKVEVGALGEADLRFQTVSLVFLPHEVEQVNEVWEATKAQVAGSKAVWLARWADYDRALDAIEAAARSHGVKNTATALMVVLEVFSRHLGDLAEGWLDEDGEALKRQGRVPLASVLGSDLIPPPAGGTVKKALDVMVGRGELESGERWQALETWAQRYLDG